tara:strand:- start:148 stop:318 length:171 start_codon:yes stop_codon:yes gene_type:complete
MNVIDRNKMITKAIEAKRSGNHRLGQLIAHQIVCLSEGEIPINTRKVLEKLGASLK